jgi:hypothetical protein
MTRLRSADLQLFLTSAEAAIRYQCGVDGRMRRAAQRMFTALQAPSTQAVRPGTTRLPVCHHPATTLEHARRQPGPIGALADAFVVIEPQLTWKVRAGAEALGEQFLDGAPTRQSLVRRGLRYGAMSGSA